MMISQGKRGPGSSVHPTQLEKPAGSFTLFVTGPHLSYPASPGKAVVREPVEEGKAAVVVLASLGPAFGILVPLDGSGRRWPVPAGRRVCERVLGNESGNSTRPPPATPHPGSVLLPAALTTYSFTMTSFRN